MARKIVHPNDVDKAAQLWIRAEELRAELAEVRDKLDQYLLDGVSPGELAKIVRANPSTVSQYTTRARRKAGIPLRGESTDQ